MWLNWVLGNGKRICQRAVCLGEEVASIHSFISLQQTSQLLFWNDLKPTPSRSHSRENGAVLICQWCCETGLSPFIKQGSTPEKPNVASSFYWPRYKADFRNKPWPLFHVCGKSMFIWSLVQRYMNRGRGFYWGRGWNVCSSFSSAFPQCVWNPDWLLVFLHSYTVIPAGPVTSPRGSPCSALVVVRFWRTFSCTDSTWLRVGLDSVVTNVFYLLVLKD